MAKARLDAMWQDVWGTPGALHYNDVEPEPKMPQLDPSTEITLSIATCRDIVDLNTLDDQLTRIAQAAQREEATRAAQAERTAQAEQRSEVSQRQAEQRSARAARRHENKFTPI